jgi:hypothetical protein
MPLNKSGGKAAFSDNVSAEMHAGRPQKQAVAIAYSVQRKAKGAGSGPGPKPATGKKHLNFKGQDTGNSNTKGIDYQVKLHMDKLSKGLRT